MPDVQTSDPISIDRVERFLARVERMEFVSREQASQDFLAGLLACDIADAAAVWVMESRDVTCIASSQSGVLPLPDPIPERIASSGAIEVPQTNGGHRILAVAEIHAGSRVLIDVSIAGVLPQTAIDGRLEILEGVAEVAGIQLLKQQHGQLRQQLRVAELSAPLLDVLAEQRSLTESSQLLAQAILNFADSDRVTILETHAGGTTVLAMSPSESIDHRATQVRLMRRLVEEVASTGSPLTFTVGRAEAEQLAPEALTDYIDESGVREIRVDVSERGRHGTCIAVVTERFTLNDEATGLDHLIAESTLPVMRQLIDRHNTGIKGVLHRFSTSTAARRTATIVTGLVVALVALFVIPTDFAIPVDGNLRPVASRRVFAPSDGVIEQIFVSHGDLVALDQPLLKIRDPDLERRVGEIDGEIATLRTQLAAVLALRTRSTRERDRDESSTQLSVQAEDLEIQIDGLIRQKKLLSEHAEDLKIASPIVGRIQRWDIQQALPGRPVNLGQHLLDVVDLDTNWELRLDIPDDVVGYVNTAQSQRPCEVAFRIRSNPATTYRTEIDWIANSTQLDEGGSLHVLAVAPLPHVTLQDPRGGAAVSAQIDCGRRSVGFVWFREVIELVQRNFVF